MPPFVSVPVPPLPEGALGCTLFKDIALESWFRPEVPSSSKGSSGPPPKKGFQFGKALSGIKSEMGSAVTSKGDGSFPDGSHIMRDGNKVYIGPDALTGDKAEETLAKLDQMAKMPDPKKQPAKKAQLPVSQFRGVAESAAATTLYDLDDSSDSAATSISGAKPPSAAASSVSRAGLGWSFEKPEEPKYTLKDTSTDSGGCGHLELVVHMPKCSTAADIDVVAGVRTVKITVPSMYRLVLDLPATVDDGSIKCKWSSKKNQMTVILHKKG